MSVHNLKAMLIAKRNVNDIPKVLKTLENAKKELLNYQYFLHIELTVESIDEAMEELGYNLLRSQEILKNKGDFKKL